MLLVIHKREEVLELIPKGGHVAEIGVDRGDFSRQILTKCAPDRLHLIDPWENCVGAHYAKDAVITGQDEMDNRADHVARAFADEIAQGVVTIHRDYSQNAATQIEDESLDWVYIDGDHSYKGARRDLDLYFPKVKPDGFILGHDYTNHETYRNSNYGVVEAVNDFYEANKVQFVLLTMEQAPTFLLAKDPKAERTLELLINILRKCAFFEIKDFPKNEVMHKRARLTETEVVDFLSF